MGQSMGDILSTMTTVELEAARARLVLMSDIEPGRDVAIKAIDKELLARDISRYPRDRYLGARK
jgi:hypothetical protein